MKYGEPRYTKDIDVWVNNSALNSLHLVEALKKFGAPVEQQRESGDVAVFDDSILQVPPRRSETDFPGERQRESLMNEIRSKKKRFKLDRTSYEQVRRQVLRRDGWRCRAR